MGNSSKSGKSSKKSASSESRSDKTVKKEYVMISADYSKESSLVVYYKTASLLFNPLKAPVISQDYPDVSSILVNTTMLHSYTDSLFEALRHFPNLKAISIRSAQSNYLEASDLMKMAEKLPELGAIEKLELDFTGNFRLDAAEDAKSKCNKNGIAKLANAIGSIQTLRYLSFVFEECNLQDDSLSELFNGLYSSQITTLQLNLQSALIGKLSGFSLAILMNNQQNKIDDLTMKVELTPLRGDFFSEFFQFIKIDRFQLKKLAILLSSCNSIGGLLKESMLGNFFKLNTSLQEFTLQIQNNFVDDNSIADFVPAMCSHSALQQVKLNLSNNAIVNVDTLKILGNSIANQPTLTRIYLKLEALNLVIPSELLSVLKTNKHLSHFQLFLSQNTISSTFLENLLEVFSGELLELKLLQLSIWNSTEDNISTRDPLIPFLNCLNESKSLGLEVLKIHFPTQYTNLQELAGVLQKMRPSIHTFQFKTSCRLFSSILDGLQKSSICELQIVDQKSRDSFSVQALMKSIVDIIKTNESLNKLSIEGGFNEDSSSFNMVPEISIAQEFNNCLSQSHKICDCFLSETEKGGNIFETLPSYELIKIRRSMFCFVLAFTKTIVPELSAYSLDVFWDLHSTD